MPLPSLGQFARWILGYDTFQGAPIVQPHTPKTAGTYYGMGHEAIAPMTTHGFTTEVLTVAPVGYSQPDIVNVYGFPETDHIPGAVPSVAQNDAGGGSC